MPNNKFSQISLLDIYEDVNSSFTEKKSELVSLLEEHIDFSSLIHLLVDFTEPICREIDSKKADYLIFDTSGIEPYVAENNPEFQNIKLKEAKKPSKGYPEYNQYLGDAAFDSYNNYTMPENVLIHIRIKISECIRVFREIQNIWIILTNKECILKELSLH